MRGAAAAFAVTLAVAAAPAIAAQPIRPATSLGHWAAVIVAGDDQSAHEDTPTEAFDNARRDVTAAFEARGLAPANLAQFSLHPERYPPVRPLATAPGLVFARLRALAKAAPDGCLVYITSHGSQDGVVVGRGLVAPQRLAAAIDGACGARPTAVVVSACFSGVFMDTLKAPNRFVLTAARRDRSSFGCGESDKYPFFDGCVIEDLPQSTDFADLARRVRLCVAAREDVEGMRPRSQPQVFIGPRFSAMTPPFAALRK